MQSLLPYRNNVLTSVEEEFNRLFDRFFGPDSLNTVRSKNRSGYPKMDLLETDKQFILEVEMPGVSEEDLVCEILPASDATANRKILRLSGKKNYEHQYPEGTVFHIKEMRRSQFTREILLPENIQDEPEALYDDGILKLSFNKVTLPLKQETKVIPIVKKANA